ncbi:acyltransferase domain-containing protein [Streptomyces sp. NPDC090442]|uniref:acyltransferase domain-containing protein n=1 Tax=Streptomyces sp. NPDC090442 TaxID=3365962 RepID=UPI003806F114
MTLRTAFLFPGQGGYLPGVFLHLISSHRTIRDTLDEIDALAAERSRSPVAELLTDKDAPPLQELVETEPARLHLAIFAAGMATFRLLTEEYGVGCDMVAGHSFGEITALTAAGVYRLREGAEIVCLRDDAFAECPPPPGGLLALNTGHRRAAHILGAVDAWDVVIAADNSPEQVVVSGPLAALGRVGSIAETLGLRATHLRAPYPFHHPLLAPAAERFAKGVADIPRRTPRVKVFSPLLAREVSTGDDATEVVVGHLTRPVRFSDSVRALRGYDVRRFVEAGPRTTLTDLVVQTVPAVETLAPLRRRTDSQALRTALLPPGSEVPPAPEATGVPATSEPVPAPHPDPPPPGSDSGPSAAQVLEELREMYAEAVGYPVEVFEPGVELEADLGIDSIQQTELFAQIITRHGLAVDRSALRITNYSTLESVAELVVSLPHATSGTSSRGSAA